VQFRAVTRGRAGTFYAVFSALKPSRNTFKNLQSGCETLTKRAKTTAKKIIFGRKAFIFVHRMNEKKSPMLLHLNDYRCKIIARGAGPGTPVESPVSQCFTRLMINPHIINQHAGAGKVRVNRAAKRAAHSDI